MQAHFPSVAIQRALTGVEAGNDWQQAAPATRDPLLLSVCRVSTFSGQRWMSASTGFFFEHQHRVFLVTSRHVFHDVPSQHYPDRITFGVHSDLVDLTRIAMIDLPLYRDGRALWIQGQDSGGEIDVAVLELPANALPPHVRASAFTLASICRDPDAVPLGAPIVLACFPLGFYDTTHLLPVARQGSIASAYGIRFQGRGCFLTDARMHRGSSGAPVVVRQIDRRNGAGPWTLLGVHSARMDMGGRDTDQDDMLGLNLAWYADILATLADGQGRP